MHDGLVRVARHEQNSNVRTDGLDPRREFAAADSGHYHVGHEQVNRSGMQSGKFQRGMAILGFNYSVSGHFQILAGVFGDHFRLAGTNGLVIDQIAADAESDGSSFEELCCRGQRDATGGDKFNLWKRRFESLEILGSADSRAREDLNRVGSSFPRGNNFSRGKSARKDSDVIAAAHLDGSDVQRWTYDELRSG